MNRLTRFFGTLKNWLDEPVAIPLPANAPVDMLVIDGSGSMGFTDYPPSRLDGAKQAGYRFMAKRAAMVPKTCVGIVTFSHSSSLVAHPMPVKENLAKLKQALDGMSLSGATNISAGLERAYLEIRRIEEPGDRRVVLLTDGHATNGANPVDTAREIKLAGIQVDIVGIGGSPREVNEAQLKEMASVVNGELRYWFIGSVGGLLQRFEALALREIK